MVLVLDASSACALTSNFYILCAGPQGLPHLRFYSLSGKMPPANCFKKT